MAFFIRSSFGCVGFSQAELLGKFLNKICSGHFLLPSPFAKMSVNVCEPLQNNGLAMGGGGGGGGSE
jgi:hypothetical protein